MNEARTSAPSPVEGADTCGNGETALDIWTKPAAMDGDTVDDQAANVEAHRERHTFLVFGTGRAVSRGKSARLAVAALSACLAAGCSPSTPFSAFETGASTAVARAETTSAVGRTPEDRISREFTTTSPASISIPPSGTTTTIGTIPAVDDRIGDPACLDQAVFGDPNESEYLLPYEVGARHRVMQSYCNPDGGHRHQIAYDFSLAIGGTVVASRDGVVVALREGSPDDGRGQGTHNYVNIRHDDGTVAFYAHLRRNGVIVEVGDRVDAGQAIAAAGNSGLTASPHLHFGVYCSWPPRETCHVPVNFRNARGPLDAWRGLVEGGVYVALPPES